MGLEMSESDFDWWVTMTMTYSPLRHGCRNSPLSDSQYMLFTPQKCNGKNTRSTSARKILGRTKSWVCAI